jgi:tRNA threonylcarbamoyladenosine biosynthesis protein TsaB
MILLLDTTTPTARLVFIEDGIRKNYEWQAERELAKGLLRWVKECLDTEDIQFSNISGIGVKRGPGSFTGIRIGLTVMNTLAESLQIPIVGAIGELWRTEVVDSLEAGQNERVVLPYYDRAATITSPRK